MLTRDLSGGWKQRLALGCAILKQIFTDGFFHGDLHPGNLLVLPGNVLCMFDLGMVGRLQGENRRLMIRYWIRLFLLVCVWGVRGKFREGCNGNGKDSPLG